MPLLGTWTGGGAGVSAVDTWEAMTSQYCRKRRKKVLVSAEIAVIRIERVLAVPVSRGKSRSHPIEFETNTSMWIINHEL